jgi:hypothetical protein
MRDHPPEKKWWRGHRVSRAQSNPGGIELQSTLEDGVVDTYRGMLAPQLRRDMRARYDGSSLRIVRACMCARYA